MGTRTATRARRLAVAAVPATTWLRLGVVATLLVPLLGVHAFRAAFEVRGGGTSLVHVAGASTKPIMLFAWDASPAGKALVLASLMLAVLVTAAALLPLLAVRYARATLLAAGGALVLAVRAATSPLQVHSRAAAANDLHLVYRSTATPALDVVIAVAALTAAWALATLLRARSRPL